MNLRQNRIIVTCLLVVCAVSASAQGFLENLGREAARRAVDRVERKVEDKVNDGVDSAVDEAFDSAGKAIKGKGKKSEKETTQQKENAAESVEESSSQSQTEWEAPASKVKSVELIYAKSDFVRGDEVIFEDLLVGEQLGEFPSQWDLLEGSAEIAKIDGVNVIKALNPGDVIAPLFEDMKNYLPEKFTIELDFWVGASENGHTNAHRISLFDNSGNECQCIDFNVDDGENGSISWDYRAGDDHRNGSTDAVAVERQAWNHFALSFNKRAMKLYINGVRYANIPNTNQPNWFSLQFNCWGGWYMNNSAIRNVVVAKGAVPLYDRMMNEGKFITYGITFDVGKSVIKPESMGEINRIVQLMTENPELKFSVEGHTDSTGSAASNQTLSHERAQAIVGKLVEMGVAKERLTAVGKGQNEPLADNSTDEGRARNRRVEFVKM